MATGEYMRDGVVYLIAGNKHSVLLVVSLVSLRRHWDGPVSICATDDSGFKVASKIAADSRLRAEVIRMPRGKRHRRNGGYVNKTKVWRYVPYDRSVFIDADTVVVGAFDEMFPKGDEMVLTSFGGWISIGGILLRRINKWKSVEPDRVKRMVMAPWPALNTGVFGFTPKTKFVRDWYGVTEKNVSFLCDEIAAQVMYPDYPVRLEGDKYNCSPLYGQQKRDVRIWHMHGKKHCRSECIEIWWPEYEHCLMENYADLREWTPAGDNRLKGYLDGLSD